MKYLRSIVSILSLILGSISILLVASVFGLLDRTGKLGWIPTRLWALTVLYTGGVTSVRTRGVHKLRQTRGSIIMSNHESHFDAVVMMAIADVPLRFLARHNLFYLPVLGWAMWANGHIPVRRDSLRKAYSSLQRAGEVLAQGSRVLIFPEGSRAAGAELLSFKQGGFLLAIDGGVPIIPVGLAGTREVCPKGWHWAGHGPVSVVVGDPLSPEGLSRKDRSSFVQLVRQRITELRDDARQLNLASEVRESPHTIGTQTQGGIDLQ